MRNELRERPSELDRLIANLGDDVARAVDELVADAFERIEDMAFAMLGALREKLPTYGQGWSRATTEDVQASVKRTAGLLLTCLRDDRPPSRQELISLTTVGIQRAREGVSRADVATAMEVCREAGYAFLLRKARPVHEWSMETALSAAALISQKINCHLLVARQAVDEGFTEAEAAPPRSGRTRNEAILANRILDGRWRTESELRLAADRLGKPLGRRHGVLILVGTSKSTDGPLVESAARVADGLARPSLLETTRWFPVAHVPALVSVACSDEWADFMHGEHGAALEQLACDEDLVAVLSPPLDSLDAVPELYRRMQIHLGYLVACRAGPGLVSSRRLEMFALLAHGAQDLGWLSRFLRQVFGPVEAEPNADLLFAIIEAFSRVSGNNIWGVIARQLNCHRNTLMPHVRKIERLTGLRFDNVADVHELVTASRLRTFLRSQVHQLDAVD